MNAPAADSYLKCCFHSHTRERNPYSSSELLAAANSHGYHVLAITEHNEVYFPDKVRREADRQGILLMPGIEVSVGEDGVHVLILNTQNFPSRKMNMRDMRVYLQCDVDVEKVLVIAPHPYYPRRICLGSQLDENIELFDAIEFSYFRPPFFDLPNRRAVRTARRYNRPLIGTGDVHRLWHLEPTYTLVRSERDPDAVVRAIKESGFDDSIVDHSANGHLPDRNIVVKTRFLSLGEMTSTISMALFEGDTPIIKLPF